MVIPLNVVVCMYLGGKLAFSSLGVGLSKLTFNPYFIFNFLRFEMVKMCP